MSRSRIVKYKPSRYGFFEDYLNHYPVAYRLNEYGFSNRTIPESGKISLSLKCKKRRILISGKIVCEMESCREQGLIYNYFFIPNDIEKIKRYLSLIVQ